MDFSDQAIPADPLQNPLNEEEGQFKAVPAKNSLLSTIVKILLISF